MGKNGVVLMQFILCILPIHVRNSNFGLGHEAYSLYSFSLGIPNESNHAS